MTTPTLRLLSLGAGVQSTTLALMAAAGEFDVKLDGAIFADTGWEPKAVYAHLAWLTSVLPYPVHVKKNGNIREGILQQRLTKGGKRAASVPWFLREEVEIVATKLEDQWLSMSLEEIEEAGEFFDSLPPTEPVKRIEIRHGQGSRQCSSEYKIVPIIWKVRELLGKGRKDGIAKGAAEIWIGISVDEASRMKDARQAYMRNRWPLIEKRMTRQDCLTWLKKRGYPEPPKSACIGCPFHNGAMWRDMKANHPEEFADAVEVDKALREGNARGMRGQEFMHSKRIPLTEAVRLPIEDGQPNLFENECEGICGV
jgi:hypothetical protein